MPRRNEPVERMCAVSRVTRPVGELIRFVLDPEGAVVPDIRRRLPGRGAWVTARRTMVETAERRNVFAKAFGEPAKVAPGLADRVGERLEAAALGSLGLARKAGAVVSGFTKAEAAVSAGKAAALIHASDAADDGVRKLEAAARKAGGLPSIRNFSSSQLGLALGGANVVHAALLAGLSGDDVLEHVGALCRYLEAEGASDGTPRWWEIRADELAGQKR